MTRFWKRAGVKEDKGKQKKMKQLNKSLICSPYLDSITVVLDNRNLRTPSKNVVSFPLKQRELALLTAAEWDAQTKNLKAHTLPLVKLFPANVRRNDIEKLTTPSCRPQLLLVLSTVSTQVMQKILLYEELSLIN